MNQVTPSHKESTQSWTNHFKKKLLGPAVAAGMGILSGCADNTPATLSAAPPKPPRTNWQVEALHMNIIDGLSLTKQTINETLDWLQSPESANVRKLFHDLPLPDNYPRPVLDLDFTPDSDEQQGLSRDEQRELLGKLSSLVNAETKDKAQHRLQYIYPKRILPFFDEYIADKTLGTIKNTKEYFSQEQLGVLWTLIKLSSQLHSNNPSSHPNPVVYANKSRKADLRRDFLEETYLQEADLRERVMYYISAHLERFADPQEMIRSYDDWRFFN